MQNKPRVFITLHTRGKNSLGENRLRLNHAAFHWGILISPKSPSQAQSHHAFDVTDSIDLDSMTGTNRNPDQNWRFRARTCSSEDDPALAFRILVRVMVGKVPGGVSLKLVEGELASIPLPRKGMEGQNCVSWTREGIRVLRYAGLVEEFGLNEFMDDALGLADGYLGSGKGVGGVVNYTTREM